MSFQKVKQSCDISDIRLTTGQSNLDYILGGLQVGSILLVEEDKYEKHAEVLSKMFVSAGVQHQNPIFYATLEKNINKSKLLLPAPGIDWSKDDNDQNGSSDMRIAWRYNALPQFDSSIEPSKSMTSPNFDLSRTLEPEIIEKHEIHFWTGNETSLVPSSQIFSNPKFDSLLNFIHAQLKSTRYSRESTSVLNTENFPRIFIQSIGSPLWYSENLESDLIKFFTLLNSFVKNSTAVCLVTIPAHLLETVFFKSTHTIARIYNSCDFVIELKAICSHDEIKSVFKDYTGILNLKKLSAFNSLTHNYIGTYDLAYKLSSKRFNIETLHLPPDIPEGPDADSKSSGVTEMPSMSCNVTKKHLLEF